MVKKDFAEATNAEPLPNTEDSSINHINNLIASADDKEELVVTEEDKAYESKDVEPTPEQEKIKKDARPISKPNTDKVEPKEKVKPKIVVRKFVPKKKKIVIRPVAKKAPERPKMIKHKDAKKGEAKHKSKGPGMIWLWIAIAAVIIIAVGVAVFRTPAPAPVVNQTVNEVAATVNGEPIYVKDIEDQYSRLDPVMQKVYTKETLLNQTIDEVLLVQEAKKLQIAVNPDEVKTEVDNFKRQNQLTDQQLNDVLTKQNLTLDDLQKLIEKRLMVRDLLNVSILQNITISDLEIKDYYDKNQDKFTQPEKVKVQHILIMIKDNVTEQMARTKIDQVASMLNDTNFCDLVKAYSDDTGSLATCGIYTFGAGEMVIEFENASFNLDINKTTIVKSIYGFHLIKKLDSYKSQVTPLSNVSDSISQTLHDSKAQQNFDLYLAQLRAKANIINYLAKTQTTLVPVDTVSPPPVAVKNYDDFAKCLTNKSVVFYGAYWCPHCLANKDMFGDSIKYVNYVECAVEGNSQLQTPECEKAGISGYPTWVINGQKYAGEQTLEGLAKLTGCVLPQ